MQLVYVEATDFYNGDYILIISLVMSYSRYNGILMILSCFNY